MELEIKHIIPYLPYHLRIQIGNIKEGYDLEMSLEDEMDSNSICLRDVIENNHKPILYPLEYLTKEIEVNGEKFVPYEKIKKMYPIDTFSSTSNTAQWSYRIIQKLAEWHFDFQGLIPAGLAISYNDLNK
jgi:hypothetical protein